MLENGADVRMIQAILGHVMLTTTEIYTHVAITKLEQVHTAIHPAARLGPGQGDGERDAGSVAAGFSLSPWAPGAGA